MSEQLTPGKMEDVADCLWWTFDSITEDEYRSMQGGVDSNGDEVFLSLKVPLEDVRVIINPDHSYTINKKYGEGSLNLMTVYCSCEVIRNVKILLDSRRQNETS